MDAVCAKVVAANKVQHLLFIMILKVFKPYFIDGICLAVFVITSFVFAA